MTGPVFVGIDPAMRKNGWAVLTSGGVRYGGFDGIENLYNLDPLACLPGDCRIYLLIEYPTWRGNASAASVRAAANCWIRYIRGKFPRRVKIRRVNPATWLSQLGLLKRDVEPASLYTPWAQGYLNFAAAFATDGGPMGPHLTEDMAAAVCLSVLARWHVEDGTFLAKTWAKDLEASHAV